MVVTARERRPPSREPYIDVAAVTCGKGVLWSIIGALAERSRHPSSIGSSGPVPSFMLEKAIEAGLSG